MKTYQSTVQWDLTLTDIEAISSHSTNGDYQGLVIRATKVSGTVPDAVVGKYAQGAKIINVVTGVWYRMTGTTASPVWTAY